jgi:outer membrane autotransporter protein
MALYGQHDFCDYWFLNWMGAAGYNNYSQKRHFNFGNLFLEPRGHFHGWQLGAKGEVGYEYIYGNYHLIPYASLYYSYLDLSSFTEDNVDTAGQVVDSQDYSMLQGGVGIRAAYNFMYSNANFEMVVLQPEIHAQILHDFINDGMETNSQFIGGGPSFVTRGFTPAATGFNIGGGVSTYGTYSDLIFTITYDLHVKDDYVANSGFIRARYEW